MANLLLILVSVFLGSIGQVILKVGANKLGTIRMAPEFIIDTLFKIVKTPEIILGLAFFGTSFLLWIVVLTKSDLSYAYPMVALGYINVVILSYFLFHEPFTANKVFGIAMIIGGILMINK